MVFGFLFLFSLSAYSQTTSYQGWIELMANKMVTKNMNMENAFTYSTLFTHPRWRAYDYSLCFERNFKDRIDVIGQFIASYTNQTADYNTLELRPIVGLRWYGNKPEKHRYHWRVLGRLEQRNMLNLEDKSWSSSMRPRVRFELVFPIIGLHMTDNKILYGMIDYEVMYYSDHITERFANRSRSRIGIGYRFNDNWRIELIAMWQQSRNNINESYNNDDYIGRIRIRYFFSNSYNRTIDGIGN